MALEVFVDFGSRDIPKNELELRAHQRGLNGRDVGDAIRAFQRRGWVEHNGSRLVITEAAFKVARDGAPTQHIVRRHKQLRVPNLFD